MQARQISLLNQRPRAVRLDAHHIAWLQSHPSRSAAWLAKRLRDGFDVHHLNGEHTDNAGKNLVLIDHVDHMRLHCSPTFIRMRPGRGVQLRAEAAPAMRRATAVGPSPEHLRAAYDMHGSGATWIDIGRSLGVGLGAAKRAVRIFAISAGMPWPVTPHRKMRLETSIDRLIFP